MDPDFILSYYYLGIMKHLSGDYAGALVDLDRVVARYPGFAAGYNERGKAKLELKDPTGALDDFAAAISLDSFMVDAYYNRGVVELERGTSRRRSPTSTGRSTCSPTSPTPTTAAARRSPAWATPRARAATGTRLDRWATRKRYRPSAPRAHPAEPPPPRRERCMTVTRSPRRWGGAAAALVRSGLLRLYRPDHVARIGLAVLRHQIGPAMGPFVGATVYPDATAIVDDLGSSTMGNWSDGAGPPPTRWPAPAWWRGTRSG